MFPQKNRVGTQEFMRIIERGKRLNSANLSLVFLPNDSSFKVSVVASKKLSKKAPERNKEKRRLREAIKKSAKEHPDLPYFCIFFIKKSIRPIPFAILQAEVSDLISKIR